jgi:NAD(P)-dependent dehydrogenase (short-subunit alcohol dehydrogenase family)
MVVFRLVLPGMIATGSGAIIPTRATAGLRGNDKFSASASAKFALRGSAQSLAREYGPSGIHVAHVILDGCIMLDA